MNNNKHIALVYLGNFFFDARLINMTLSLLQENYRVSIIHTHPSDWGLYNKLFRDVEFHDIHLIKTGGRRYLEFHKKVKKILQKEQCDIILSGDLYSLAAVTACKHLAKQIIYDCREIYFELAAHNKKPLHRYWNYLFEKHHLQSVDKIMVTADTDLQFLQKKYIKHTHLKWYTIYNYPFQSAIKNLTHLSHHSPKKINVADIINDKELRDILSQDNIKIIYQGVIQKGRGIKELIDLANYNSNISAIIVGYGEHSKHYINYNEKYNRNNNVYFIGSVPYLKLFTITSQCDIGWAMITKRGLSNEFALPNKLFEYLVSGIPVLASGLPNISKIINKYRVGEIVQSNTIEECNKMIIKIYKDRDEYKKNILVTAKNFTWDIQHCKFMEIVNGK